MPRPRFLATAAIVQAAIMQTGCAGTPPPQAAAPSEAGMVLFRQAEAVRPAPIPALRGLPGRVLRDAGEHGLAVEMDFAQAAEDRRIVSHADGVEFYVLKGQVSLGTVTLAEGDFAFVPAGSAYGPFRAGAGTRLLAFSAGSATLRPETQAAPAKDWKVLRSGAMPWTRSTTGAEAGTPLAIDIKLLWADERSGRSTFLARMDAGTAIPWESHPVDEEGYLIEGAHEVDECPPSGLQHGRYTPRGYFFRPPDLIHMGPRSVNPVRSTWLIRTSGTLADTFYPGCPFPAKDAAK